MKYFSDNNYDYFINLSGECYPIKSIAAIKTALQGQTSAFMEIFKIPFDGWSNDGGLFRIQNRFYIVSRGKGLPRIIHLPRLNKKLPNDLEPYGGSQWFCLPREMVNYITDFIRTNPKICKFFRRTLIPDEMFFQTVLMNSSFKAQVKNDNLRYINFEEGESGHPKYLTAADFNKFMDSGKLFARKFNAKDKEVLDLIDRNTA
jgi:hypothetical protein